MINKHFPHREMSGTWLSSILYTQLLPFTESREKGKGDLCRTIRSKLILLVSFTTYRQIVRNYWQNNGCCKRNCFVKKTMLWNDSQVSTLAVPLGARRFLASVETGSWNISNTAETNKKVTLYSIPIAKYTGHHLSVSPTRSSPWAATKLYLPDPKGDPCMVSSQ